MGETKHATPCLAINGLKTYFFTDQGVLPSVDGVSFEIGQGKTLGVVGESGCGKSVTALSILRLVPAPPGRIVGGSILFDNRELTKLSSAEMRRIRGNEIAMIFQEPMTSLNPVYTIGNQLLEAITLHLELGHQGAHDLAVEMLTRVGIPSPARRMREYPHQLSGGMRQRVMIAMALSCNPRLLIADEPTTALDVTIQAQILELLDDLQQSTGMSILLITHDLGVVAECADLVAVMYAGKIVEHAPVRRLFESAMHPYTQGLFLSIPSIGPRTTRLSTIEGVVPDPLHFPSGCRFHDRCARATEECTSREPQLRQLAPGHTVACHHAEEG